MPNRLSDKIVVNKNSESYTTCSMLKEFNQLNINHLYNY